MASGARQNSTPWTGPWGRGHVRGSGDKEAITITDIWHQTGCAFAGRHDLGHADVRDYIGAGRETGTNEQRTERVDDPRPD